MRGNLDLKCDWRGAHGGRCEMNGVIPGEVVTYPNGTTTAPIHCLFHSLIYRDQQQGFMKTREEYEEEMRNDKAGRHVPMPDL